MYRLVVVILCIVAMLHQNVEAAAISNSKLKAAQEAVKKILQSGDNENSDEQATEIVEAVIEGDAEKIIDAVEDVDAEYLVQAAKDPKIGVRKALETIVEDSDRLKKSYEEVLAIIKPDEKIAEKKMRDVGKLKLDDIVESVLENDDVDDDVKKAVKEAAEKGDE